MFYHTSIVGLPGSGKTTTAKKMLSLVGHGCAYVDLAPKDYDYHGVPVVHDGRSAMTAVLEGRKVAWPGPSWEMVSWVDHLITMQKARDPMPPVTVFFDEAHLVAPKGSIKLERDIPPDPIALLASQGDNHLNIRAVWITQRPQALDPWVYRLATIKIFHRLDPADRDYFRRQGVSVPDLQGFDTFIQAPGVTSSPDDEDEDEDENEEDVASPPPDVAAPPPEVTPPAPVQDLPL